MSYLRDKFASLNSDHPEESVSLVVETVRKSFDKVRIPLDSKAEILRTQRDSNLMKLQKLQEGTILAKNNI